MSKAQGKFDFSVHHTFNKNILICVPKMNETLTGLVQYEGE